MVDEAKKLDLGGLAICDRGGLYGSVRAHGRAKEIGQRLITGAEVSLFPGDDPDDPMVVGLLVENHLGYSNLCELLTRAHATRPKGQAQLDCDGLADHHRGLLAVVPLPVRPSNWSGEMDLMLGALKENFGSRLALASYRHLDGLDRERTALAEYCSQRFQVPVVASARPLYHCRSRKRLADILFCIRNGITLDQAGTRISSNSEAVLRAESTLLRLFPDHPEWVERTAELAQDLRFQLSELCYSFPCTLSPGETADQKLRKLVEEGVVRRFPGGVPLGVAEQLEKELRIIGELNVAPYFLSTWEIVEIAREKRILCQGRGSAANSAVCYVLGITAVDPSRSSLLFERFLSAERHEPPDIDVDFEHERREEVIQEIYRRYGRGRAAMVSEVICYRGKSAFREVGKVFGLSAEQVDRLSSMMGHWDGMDRLAGRLKEMGFDENDERVRQVVMFARALQGFPRHLSIHVGGFVLSAAPLTEVAPVEPARMEGRTVIPWDKDDLDALGFFKVDVLGLGMLTAIRKCLDSIYQGGGLQLPGNLEQGFDPLEVVTRIPSEDPAVYDLVCRADTVGIFQIESRAQMAMLPRLRPRRFYDLVIEVAIVRPGPIQGGMVHPYLRRKNGEEPILAPHPGLHTILERTLGVPLFQEQVMQIAIVGAGYTGGEADQLRRDMAAWKKSGKLLRHREKLLAGFEKNGIAKSFGEALFEQIKGFGEYGFPESHAASFALLVYASAWQKTHYPAHFTAALLNSQPMGFYSPSSLVQDAQRRGVEVREVCVNASSWDSTLEAPGAACAIRSEAPGARRALRLGLGRIKGMGKASVLRLEQARQERPWASLEDLIHRGRLRKGEIDALAEAGALEAVVPGRRQALWQARAPRVGGLFKGVGVKEPRVKLPALRAPEQLVLDYERKGLSVDDHPLRHLRQRLIERGAWKVSELGRAGEGQRVGVAGLVTCRQQPATASGVVFLTIEDESGQANLVLFHQVYETYRLVARYAAMVLVWGKVERDPDAKGEVSVIHVIVSELERIDVPELLIRSMSRDFH